jgi:hypothetical protein
MTGFTFILDGDSAKNWQSILQSAGITVIFDETEFKRHEAMFKKHEAITARPSHINELPYRIQSEAAELKLFEARFSDQAERKPLLVFKLLETKANRELLNVVQTALIAAGATIATKEKKNLHAHQHNSQD